MSKTPKGDILELMIVLGMMAVAIIFHCCDCLVAKLRGCPSPSFWPDYEDEG